jgi:hypothetical protein
VGHVVQETLHLAGGIAVGALVGLLLGQSKEGLVAGAAPGGLLGFAASVEAATARRL